MRRASVFLALLVAGIIGASAWLVIDASADPDPLPAVQHFPPDDDEQQQQASQADPDPDPEEADQEAPEAASDDGSSDQRQASESSLSPADTVIAALAVERPQLPEPEAAVAPEPDPSPPPPRFTTYVIESGDTLADIAGQFEIDMHELIAANMLETPDLIYIGRTLNIPLGDVQAAEPEPETAETVELVAAAEPEPPRVPDQVVPGITEGGVVFGTIHDHERGVVNSAVIGTSHGDSTIWLVEACVDGVRRTYIMGLSLPVDSGEQARIYWRFDGGTLNTDRWSVHEDRVESIRWCPFLHTLDDVEGTKDLWIRIGGIDLTFTIENFVPNELRANFFYCGR